MTTAIAYCFLSGFLPFLIAKEFTISNFLFSNPIILCQHVYWLDLRQSQTDMVTLTLDWPIA